MNPRWSHGPSIGVMICDMCNTRLISSRVRTAGPGVTCNPRQQRSPGNNAALTLWPHPRTHYLAFSRNAWRLLSDADDDDSMSCFAAAWGDVEETLTDAGRA